MDVTLVSAERLPAKTQPIAEICIINTRSGVQHAVHKCPKAITPSHVWNEGSHFTINEDVDFLNLQVALIQKGLTSTKSVGYLRCPLRDVLLFYLAHEAGAIKNTEADFELMDGSGKGLLKDQNGFKSKIKLRINPKIEDSDDIVSRDLGEAHSKGPKLENQLQLVMAEVDKYIWSETKFQDWVYEKRDAKAGDIFSQLDKIEELSPDSTQIVAVRDRLQSARGDGFTSSQIEIFLGILATLVQMVILKILMLGQ